MVFNPFAPNGHIRPKQISKKSFGTETLLCLMGDFPTSPANIFEEESDDEDIDLDDEIDDPDFQDPAHNLQYSSDSDECEMDIDHDTIPRNTKNSSALSDTDTASLSSVEIPSANASGCSPILWFHTDHIGGAVNVHNKRRNHALK
ncbi:piggyBac transposable element-derived protein 4 [Nephila pilipes]|uniref:PiggyBac transposable element-derived protein 4 n=1 Tax=Nephila pilipes TaxID=299642 RepID=A0A8X6P2Y4_NEPPI|nr:piggyBac transposable element-derived protein 4 [Nephila pilipes]